MNWVKFPGMSLVISMDGVLQLPLLLIAVEKKKDK